MYHHNKPNLHDIVFVRLISQKKDSAGNYVKLIEYNDLEGLVLCTEITKYKSNLKSLIKYDEIFPVIIISTSNGYDLSYSKIKKSSQDLLKECYEYQNKIYKLINSISNKINLDENIKNNIIKYNLSPQTYEQSVLSNNNMCKELYESILQNSDILFEKFEKNIVNPTDNHDNILQTFKTQLQTQLEVKPYYIQKEFKLLVFDDNSLYILKEILNKIKLINVDTKYNYEIECRSSPYYYYKLTYKDFTDIENNMNIIDDSIKNICNDYHCEVNIDSNHKIIKKGEITFIDK